MIRSMAGLMVSVTIKPLLYRGPEMVVAQRSQGGAIQPHGARMALAHGADAGKRDALEIARHAGTRWRGEQQFVVLAAVERLFPSGAGKPRRLPDLGAESGSQAQTMQVERQSVAQVHGGGGPLARAQKPSQRQTGLRSQMPAPRSSAALG